MSEVEVDEKGIEAVRNLKSFMEMRYPGDGVIAGLSQDGESLVEVRWVMLKEKQPKSPTFTAKCTWEHFVPQVKISVNRGQITYEIRNLKKGIGHCVTEDEIKKEKVLRDWNPFLLPINGDVSFVADFYEKILSGKAQVVLAVKFINKEGGLKMITRCP